MGVVTSMNKAQASELTTNILELVEATENELAKEGVSQSIRDEFTARILLRLLVTRSLDPDFLEDELTALLDDEWEESWRGLRLVQGGKGKII